MDAETLRSHIRRCRQLTDKPFGVNIMLMNPAAPEMAKIVVEEQVGWSPPVRATGRLCAHVERSGHQGVPGGGRPCWPAVWPGWVWTV